MAIFHRYLLNWIPLLQMKKLNIRELMKAKKFIFLINCEAFKS